MRDNTLCFCCQFNLSYYLLLLEFQIQDRFIAIVDNVLNIEDDAIQSKPATRCAIPDKSKCITVWLSSLGCHNHISVVAVVTCWHTCTGARCTSKCLVLSLFPTYLFYQSAYFNTCVSSIMDETWLPLIEVLESVADIRFILLTSTIAYS